MSQDNMNIERRVKTWQGFLRLMTYCAVAAAITLALLWAAVV